MCESMARPMYGQKRPYAYVSTSQPLVEPIPKLKRAKKTSEDVEMCAPLPVVAFIQSKYIQKACGRCVECQKPGCGKCKSCILNEAPKKPGDKIDKRRCIALKCVRTMQKTAQIPSLEAPPGHPPLPTTVDGVSAEIDMNTVELARMAGSGVFTDNPDMKKRYKWLLERKAILHSTKISLQNARLHRKSRFPVGFPDTWGIVNDLEKHRLKFAKAVVKSSGDGNANVALKRQFRDKLDLMIAGWVGEFGEKLCPLDESDANTFWKLINQPRNSMDADSYESPSDFSDSDSDDE